tara:strand:- start:1315 stop:2925 length:1611 start_codon:yes stop_codon:yes gene_type:complete
MWYDEAIKEYADINFEINKKYALKNSYHLIKSCDKKLDKHPSWEKLPLILKHIDDYDYIVMCDSDAFFYYDSPKIENVINKHPNKDFILSGDAWKYFTNLNDNINIPDINCGLMIIKNTQFSKKFIHNWCYEKHTTLASKYWEQGVMWYLYNENYMNIQNKSIIIPYNILQNFEKHLDQFFYSRQYGLKNKPFVHHLAGQSKEIRIKVSSDYYNSLSNYEFYYVISIQDKLSYSDIVKKYQIRDNYFPIIFNGNNLNELQKLEIYHNYVKNLDDSIDKIMILIDINLITKINIDNYYLERLSYITNHGFKITNHGLNIIGNKKQILEEIENLYNILKYQNKIFDENFRLINTNIVENDEQQLAKEYLHKDDIVLEIGARYGSVSCIISQKTQKSVCVEPDERVWEILEHNKKINNCNFNIVKGFISKKKLSLYNKDSYGGYGTSSKLDDNSNIQNYTLDEIKEKYNIEKFNVLIIDCEGFMEEFIDENIEILNDLRMIIFEADQPEICNYDKIKNILLDNNFIPKITGFQNVYLKN